MSCLPCATIGVSKVMGLRDGRCPEGSGGDEMIFDVLTAAALFGFGIWLAYTLGKAKGSEKKKGESDGWQGIVNYDHSEGGVRYDKK